MCKPKWKVSTFAYQFRKIQYSYSSSIWISHNGSNKSALMSSTYPMEAFNFYRVSIFQCDGQWHFLQNLNKQDSQLLFILTLEYVQVRILLRHSKNYVKFMAKYFLQKTRACKPRLASVMSTIPLPRDTGWEVCVIFNNILETKRWQ